MSAALAAMASSAGACPGPKGVSLHDVLAADVVVVGRIGSLEGVASERGLIYARLAIEVSQVLHGSAPDHLGATWANQYWTMPEVPTPAEEHVVALRWPEMAFVNGQGEEVSFDPPEPDLLTVIDVWCGGGPLIYDAESEQARAIMEVLDGDGDAQAEADALGQTVSLTRVWLGDEPFEPSEFDFSDGDFAPSSPP